MDKTFDTDAADKAAAEFKNQVIGEDGKVKPDLTAAQLADHWRAAFMRSGHNRLARILIGTDTRATKTPRVLAPAQVDLSKVA